MGLFKHCICGHIEEDHAMDAPEGERECMAEINEDKSRSRSVANPRCDCENFEWDGEE